MVAIVCFEILVLFTSLVVDVGLNEARQS